MSGLFGSLNASVKALSAHSRALEISGKNLANVNNASFARQRVVYGDRGTVITPDGAVSLGLEALSVEQLRDSLLDRQLMREISLKSSLDAEQSGYQRAQAALGQGIDRSQSAGTAGDGTRMGLAASIDDFFNAFGSLAASPTDVGERQSLIQKAAILTDRFQLADRRLAQVQLDLDAQIGSDVAAANRLMATIADLNGQIGRIEINMPGSAVDLRDQRQAKLEELATKLDIDITDTVMGQVQVSARDAAGASVLLIDQTTVYGNMAYAGQKISAGVPATELALSSGSMHGSLTSRVGPVQQVRDSLDLLAGQLVASVNAAYNPTGATGDFFAATGTTAGALRVAAGVTASSLKASDGGPAGDNTVALSVSRLAVREFSVLAGDNFDGTFSAYFANTVSSLGQSLNSANSSTEDQGNIERLVRAQRDSLSGVSLDEEMADMLRYQRAYQASARVYSIVDELLDLVVNRLGT